MKLSKAVKCPELEVFDTYFGSEYFITGSAAWGYNPRDLDVCVPATKKHFMNFLKGLGRTFEMQEGTYYENNILFPELLGSYNGKKNLPIQLIFLGRENYEIWKMATGIMVNTLKVNTDNKGVTHSLFEGLRALIKLSGVVGGIMERNVFQELDGKYSWDEVTSKDEIPY